MFQNGHTSSNLPNCDSKNFKCQQKKKPIPSWVQVGPKKAKSDETPVPSTSTSISPISQLNLELKCQESSGATIIDTDKVENESGEKNIETELHSENVEQAEKVENVEKVENIENVENSFLSKEFMKDF